MTRKALFILAVISAFYLTAVPAKVFGQTTFQVAIDWDFDEEVVLYDVDVKVRILNDEDEVVQEIDLSPNPMYTDWREWNGKTLQLHSEADRWEVTWDADEYDWVELPVPHIVGEVNYNQFHPASLHPSVP